MCALCAVMLFVPAHRVMCICDPSNIVKIIDVMIKPSNGWYKQNHRSNNEPLNQCLISITQLA